MEYLLKVFNAGLVILCSLFILNGCYVGSSFQGPGFDPEEGSLLTAKENKVFVAITHGIIESGGKAAFSDNLKRVRKSLVNSSGLIGYSVRKQLFGNEVWTMSAWTSEEALGNFISSPAHLDAVEDGGIPSDTVRSAYLWVPSEKLPLSWDEAQRYLERQQ